MKATIVIILLVVSNLVFAQSQQDIEDVKKACLDYIEGFYEGDTSKIKRSFKTTLHKYGYWKLKGSDKYEGMGMTFQEAVAYSRDVLEKEKFPSADAPRKVEILDVMGKIAAAKVTCWWGADYLLLSKVDDKWMIEQVLWEGPLK